MMKFLFVLPIMFLICCNQLPSKKLSQWDQKINYFVNGDSLFIEVDNPLECPLRIFAKTSNASIQHKLDQNFPLILEPKIDTLLSYQAGIPKDEIPIKFNGMMGNPESEILLKKLELPFPRNKQYKIIQGYNGKFSHSSNYSKYAIDFNLLEGDTICSAADGFVVGVIEDYKYGGKSKKWRDYANYITIYHPKMNIYTQYVHLMHKGSFVMVGDHIKSGQSIGLAGKTGFTSTEHLHFNVLKASKNGMKSIPSEFLESYNGIELSEGDIVKKQSR